jgi:hypothetical protein
VGISGASFRKTPEKYFIVNNVLTSEQTDQYMPLISSFVNLSYSSKSLITPGVSIGVGVPVTASENTGSLAIFVGPLIKIGKSKSFELNGGYMFSKVERLSKGVKVGDILQLGAGEIPKQRKYEGGYFIGLSYSL